MILRVESSFGEKGKGQGRREVQKKKKKISRGKKEAEKVTGVAQPGFWGVGFQMSLKRDPRSYRGGGERRSARHAMEKTVRVLSLLRPTWWGGKNRKRKLKIGDLSTRIKGGGKGRGLERGVFWKESAVRDLGPKDYLSPNGGGGRDMRMGRVQRKPKGGYMESKNNSKEKNQRGKVHPRRP